MNIRSNFTNAYSYTFKNNNLNKQKPTDPIYPTDPKIKVSVRDETDPIIPSDPTRK